MLPYKRSQRVSGLLREEISNIILRGLKDPRLGFITVTDVEITEDLKEARVFISVFKKEETIETLKILNTASNFIRKELAKRIRLKYIPHLKFYEDESIEYGERIDSLLDQIEGTNDDTT